MLILSARLWLNIHPFMDHAIGIDVGKNEMVACIRSSNGLAEQTVAFPNTMVGLKRFVRQITGQAIGKETPILLESTGPYHWKSAHHLAQELWNVRIVNPILTKRMARHSIRKRKTDKVDASHLAFLASQGYGYAFVETEVMAYRKALARHYWKLRYVLTNCRNHEKYLREHRDITGYKVSPVIERQCEKVKAKIVSEFSKGNDLRYLDSIPGITPLLGATLLAELQPLSRFERMEQLIAFAGLDPQIKQSGGKPATYSKLSKRGSPLLRKVLYCAAFGSFQRKPFNHYYQAYKARGLHHTAILCIMQRKILRIAVTLLKRREEFKEEKLGIVDKIS